MAAKKTQDSPSLTEQAGQKVQEGTEQVKAQAQQAVQQGQQFAGQIVEQITGQVKTQVTGQKERLATGITDTAEALRAISSQLQEKGHGTISPYADQIADRVGQFGETLHGKDLDQIVAETEAFARSQPTLFLGTAAALGLFAARFLKSSGRRYQNSAAS